MKTIKFDDQIGHRSRKHINVLISRNGDIIEFTGNDIPGFAKITKEGYSKHGKWSCSTWELEIPEDSYGIEFQQDWETGNYFPVSTWETAFELFSRKMKYLEVNRDVTFTSEKFEKFIRNKFPEKAREFDKSEKDLSIISSNSPEFLEFLQAQQEFAEVKEEVINLEKKELRKMETEQLKEKTRKIKEALKGGYTSLEDLKRMLE